MEIATIGLPTKMYFIVTIMPKRAEDDPIETETTNLVTLLLFMERG